MGLVTVIIAGVISMLLAPQMSFIVVVPLICTVNASS